MTSLWYFQTISRFWFHVTSTNPCNHDETWIVCSVNDSKNFLSKLPVPSINILMLTEHSKWLTKTRSYLSKSPLLNILQCPISKEQSLSFSLLSSLVLHHQLHHLVWYSILDCSFNTVLVPFELLWKNTITTETYDRSHLIWSLPFQRDNIHDSLDRHHGNSLVGIVLEQQWRSYLWCTSIRQTAS